MISRAFVLLLAFLANATAFTTVKPQQQQLQPQTALFATPNSPQTTGKRPLSHFAASMAALATSSSIMILPALAEEEAVYAELPPPYVPALFGLGLLVGVGVLTGSLGNVMDEEASLGMQSGARAKKEIERSRSSYFKK